MSGNYVDLLADLLWSDPTENEGVIGSRYAFFCVAMQYFIITQASTQPTLIADFDGNSAPIESTSS